MKAHEYWSVGALITMLGTFYSGYKGSKSSHKYFAASSLLCMIIIILIMFEGRVNYGIYVLPRSSKEIGHIGKTDTKIM